MIRTIAAAASASLILTFAPAAVTAGAPAERHRTGSPGSAGAGDPYFPLDGNGGYDTRHYLLPASVPPGDRPGCRRGNDPREARRGSPLSTWTSTGSRLHGVGWTGGGRHGRAPGELPLSPRVTAAEAPPFIMNMWYAGVPVPLEVPASSPPTTDSSSWPGRTGQRPGSPSTTTPATERRTPSGSRCRATSRRSPTGTSSTVTATAWTTWTYRAPNRWRVPRHRRRRRIRPDTYREDGIRYLDAVDPDLDARASPTTGERFAISQAADSAYNVSRTVTVPAAGGTLSFAANRQVEQGWDLFLVEAHEVGDGAWTTLADESGHTSQDTGNALRRPRWPAPLPRRALPDRRPGRRTCYTDRPDRGVERRERGAFGPEEWTVDLSQFAGQTIELSLCPRHRQQSSASAGSRWTTWRPRGGRDRRPSRAGADGWTVAGSTGGQPRQRERLGGRHPGRRARRPIGEVAGRLAGPSTGDHRLPRWLSSGVTRGVDAGASSTTFRGSASPSRPRPGRSTPSSSSPTPSPATPWSCTSSPISGTATASRCAGGRDIWLNEGFATYAEWLWSEAEGLGHRAGDVRLLLQRLHRADDPWWQITIGDPGPDQLFEFPVYFRGP